jgi:hypothetical protein
MLSKEGQVTWAEDIVGLVSESVARGLSVCCKKCKQNVSAGHRYRVVVGGVEHVNCEDPSKDAVYPTGTVCRVTHTLPDGTVEELTYIVECKGP